MLMSNIIEISENSQTKIHSKSGFALSTTTTTLSPELNGNLPFALAINVFSHGLFVDDLGAIWLFERDDRLTKLLELSFRESRPAWCTEEIPKFDRR